MSAAHYKTILQALDAYLSSHPSQVDEVVPRGWKGQEDQTPWGGAVEVAHRGGEGGWSGDEHEVLADVAENKTHFVKTHDL